METSELNQRIQSNALALVPQDQIPATDGLFGFYDGDSTVIAESVDEAYELLTKATGLGAGDMTPKNEWVKVHPERVLSIEWETGVKFKKTLADWIREQGKGLLCSENY
jgi:hypothetical protein